MSVDVGKRGDRRRLAQQPNEVVALLLEFGVSPFGAGRPTELGLDFGQESADALGRRARLLLLDFERGAFGLVVGQPSVDRAIDDQHEGDEAEEGEGEFGGERARKTPRPGRPRRRRRAVGHDVIHDAPHPCSCIDASFRRASEAYHNPERNGLPLDALMAAEARSLKLPAAVCEKHHDCETGSPQNRAGLGNLNSFPRTISGFPPGLAVLDRRRPVATSVGLRPRYVATGRRRRKLSCRRREDRRVEVSLVRGHSVKAGMWTHAIVEI